MTRWSYRSSGHGALISAGTRGAEAVGVPTFSSVLLLVCSLLWCPLRDIPCCASRRAPTYYNQVLGVPLSAVGTYTVFPMLVGFFSKLALGGLESFLLSKGTSQLGIRKIANSIATVLGCSSLVLFVRQKSPAMATLCYCGLLMGNSFDYCGFLPNYLELGAPYSSCSRCCRAAAPCLCSHDCPFRNRGIS